MSVPNDLWHLFISVSVTICINERTRASSDIYISSNRERKKKKVGVTCSGSTELPCTIYQFGQPWLLGLDQVNNKTDHSSIKRVKRKWFTRLATDSTRGHWRNKNNHFTFVLEEAYVWWVGVSKHSQADVLFCEETNDLIGS